MTGEAHKPLKLRVRDEDDLTVLSTLLQDALLPVQDMTFLPREKRFVMVLNRFCWERAPEPLDLSGQEEEEDEDEGDVRFEDVGGDDLYHRVNAGLTFDNVKLARFRGFDQDKRGLILELLSIEARDKSLFLRFAEGAEVELVISRLSGHLEDLGEPWPTTRRPAHPDKDEA